MSENSGDSALPPEGDPNAMTRRFDAFLPAPFPAEPDPAGESGDGGESPAADPYFAYPPSAEPSPAAKSGRPKGRSVLVVAAAVLVACGIGVGAYALGSSSSGGSSAAAGNPVPGATAGGHKDHTKVQTAKLTITSINGTSLTGTTAGGESITVDITSNTKFGTKARPLTASQLSAGQVVVVRGQRTGTGTYTATEIAIAPDAGTGAGAGASGGTATATPAVTPTATGPSA